MINTNPTYIPADNLSLKDYWTDLSRDVRYTYESRWSWFKKAMECIVLPIVLSFDLVVALGFLYNIIKNNKVEQVYVIIFFIVIPCLFAAVGLIKSYVDSYIASGRDERKLCKFIDEYFQGGTIRHSFSPIGKVVDWNGIEFEVVYTSIFEMKRRGGTDQLKVHKFFVAGLYFEYPDSKFSTEDNEQAFRDFESDFMRYCEGKPSCRYLIPDDRIIYASFDAEDLPTPEDFSKVLDEITYIVKRFNLIPLSLVL